MSDFVYNPGLLDVDALIRGFVARLDTLALVLEDLSSDAPPHRLFIGQRGMGKTTLLRRIAAEITRNPELSARWLALTFPEEQYNVAHLSDFWLNCLDAAADALQAAGKSQEVAEIDAFVAALPTAEADRGPQALERLLLLAGQRGLALFVDNLQQVLGRLSPDEQWALRKVLGGSMPIVVIGASPAPPLETTEYKAPFYDFFQATWLRGLSLTEMSQVLGATATNEGRPELGAQLAKQPARLRALHTLTGGNPRTIALLYRVLARNPNADIRAQLEGLIDQVTPLYKARFEELADQTQIVLGALALEWHPATAHSLATATRLDVNAVSTQLHRLHNEGLVTKVTIPGEARTGFLVAERFFNLWYLMRASRRLRGRVLAFARSLEAIYDIRDLEKLAASLTGNGGDAELMAALASVVPGEGLQRALWARVFEQGEAQDAQWKELLATLGSRQAPVMALAERMERAKKVLAEAAKLDFEGMGVERRIGEALCVCLGRGRLASRRIPGFTKLARITAANVGDYGRECGAAFVEGARLGILTHTTISECDPLDIAAAGKRFNVPQLGLLHRLFTSRAAEMIPANELIASGDAALMRLGAQRADDVVAVVREAAQIEPTNLLGQEMLAAVGGGAEAAGAALCAIELGSVDPRCLSIAIGRLPDDPRWFTWVELLTAHVDPGAAEWRGMTAFVVAPRDARLALRMWNRRPPAASAAMSVSYLLLLHALAASGGADHVRSLIMGEDGRMLPAQAAYLAATGRDLSILDKYAPEVAEGAREVLKLLWPEGLAAGIPPAPKQPGKGRKRR
ncbi:hypothetical protein LBMAG42_32220 [Deltaproteobacteria bacterium]|nr:hypothetical protein LBMAG42_32220 [Deltaproteobacteria bacterium]